MKNLTLNCLFFCLLSTSFLPKSFANTGKGCANENTVASAVVCPAPTDLAVSNITETTADLSWNTVTATVVAYVWRVYNAGDVPGIDPWIDSSTTVSGTTATATGLSANTEYDFYMQTICSASDGNSTLTGPLTFTTACTAITTFPWTEDFESVTYPALPNCWTAINNNNDGNEWTSAVGTTWAAGLYTEGNAGANDDYLVLPPFALTGNQQLKFDVRVKHDTQPNDYRVVLSTTGMDPSDFTTELMPLTTVSSETPLPVTLDLSAYTGNVYVAIHVPSGGLDGFFIYFDNFMVGDIPLVNDDLADAIPLTLDDTCYGDAYTNVGGTAQTSEPSGTCFIDNISGTPDNSVWFSFVASISGEVTVTTDISPGDINDTEIAVYAMPADVNDLSTLSAELGCDNDGGTSVPTGWMSKLQVTGLIPGNTYYVQVDGSHGATGDFCIEVRDTGCADPSGLAASNISQNSADLSWIENGSAVTWRIEYGTAGFALGSGTVIFDYDNTSSETISGLVGNTTYEFYVQAICGGSNVSAWVGPYAFTTECLFSPYYIEDFAVFVPDCWKEANSGTPATGPTGFGQGDWDNGNFLNTGNNSAAEINIYDNGDVNWLVSPAIDLSGGPFELVYTAAVTDYNYSSPPSGNGMGNDDEVRVLISQDNGLSWTTLKTYNQSDFPSATGDVEVIDLSTYLGAVKIAFWATNGTVDDPEDYDFFIDEFGVRPMLSCLEPTWLAASNISSTTADISWIENGTANAWEIEYGPAGFTPGSGTILLDTDGSPAESISGLSPSTDYEFYVTAVCAVGDESLATGPYAFTTECLFSPYYIEDFALFVPDCWKEANSGTPATGPTGFGQGDWDNGNFLNTGNNSAAVINIYGGGVNWLISPQIDLSGGPFELIYTAAVTDYNNSSPPSGNGMGSDDEVRVLISQDNGLSWTPLKTYNQSDFPSATGDVEAIDLSAYLGTVKIAFWATDGTVYDPEYYDFFIDEFKVKTPVSCLEPSGLTASNIGYGSADLSWNENGSASSWNIEYGPAGFTPGSGNILLDTDGTSAESISGLSPSTDYEFYVTAVCAVGDESFTTGPYAFTTGCLFSPYYIEDFAVFVPDCWKEADFGTPATGPTGFEQGSWHDDYFLNTGNDLAAEINIYDNGDVDWLVSPQIDLSGGPFELVYTAAVTDYENSNPPEGNGMGSDDELRVLISQDNGLSWTTLKTYNQSDFPSATGDVEVIDLSTYLGAVKIAFWATNGTVADPEDYDFFIDEFGVRPMLSCLEPTWLAASNISSTTADISWIENGTSGSWQIEYGPTGFALGTGVIINDADGVSNEQLTALLSGMGYDFYVRSVCNPGDYSAWVGPKSFNTKPSNDDLNNAIALTLNANCSGDAYTNVASTTESNEPSPSCWGDSVSTSVWFTFVAPPSGSVIVSTDILPGVLDDSQIAVYPAPTNVNDLSTLPSAIGCDDDSGVISSLLMSVLILNGLTPNDTYYVQVNGYNGREGTFCIEVTDFDYIYSEGAWSPTNPSGISSPTENIVVLNGEASLTADTQMNNLSISSGATLLIEEAISPSGDIENNGNLIFINNITKLGQLGDMTGSTITGTGEVTVQRYIPARDDGKGAYRYLTSAVNSTGNIHSNWQEGAIGISDNPNPGFGMFITGSSTGANGFDQTASGAPSMFTFDETTQAYAGVPNTNVTQLDAGLPYTAYVWGDRSVDIISSNDPLATTTTLRATGNLVTGNQTSSGSSTAGEFNLFGNPYQAIVDMNDVLANSTNLNPNLYYVWDPNLGTRGAYATVSLPTGAPTPSTSDANQFLQPGQAAWTVNTGGAPTILFEESDKDVSQTPTDVFRPQNVASIELQLFQTDRFANGQSLSDAVRVNFSPGESNAVLPNDAPKLWNFDETIALVNGSEYLAVENRSLPVDGEILQLYNDQYRVSDYVFKAIVNDIPDNITAYLKDDYLNTQIPLNNNGATLVNFSVDETVPASIAPDRFSIVFALNGLSTDAFASESFSLYPNPVKNGSFFVLVPGLAGEEVQVSLYDLLGRKVYQTTKTIGSDKRAEIKAINLQTGIYMVKMEHEGKSFTEKLIVE